MADLSSGWVPTDSRTSTQYGRHQSTHINSSRRLKVVEGFVPISYVRENHAGLLENDGDQGRQRVISTVQYRYRYLRSRFRMRFRFVIVYWTEHDRNSRLLIVEYYHSLTLSRVGKVCYIYGQGFGSALILCGSVAGVFF
jgi:hypothetical protein